MHFLLKYGISLLALASVECVPVSAQMQVKSIQALQVSDPVVIDGHLNEAVWQRAEKAVAFIQLAPRPGEPSPHASEISILYDNDAVYVGANLVDSGKDNIMRQLSERDDDGGNTDIFTVSFDTYFDHQNAFTFGVTAAGVQLDGIVKFDGVNASWNAAWYSKVAVTDDGWTVEMKIPYSAIRFPNKKEQIWGVNFLRSIRRDKERSYWSKIDPTVPNGLSQEGMLTGIHDIKAPVRLSLLPYVSVYGANYGGANSHSINGGMDIKYGINESFTLDMTLVPDFGQTIYDSKVLNLSPIEVRYNEKRYFFTEGLDLFNKNDLFYSRRVGGEPVNFNSPVGFRPSDSVLDNPSITRLYNATKLSGRTKHNLGIGFFNAVSGPTSATVRDSAGIEHQLQTAPLTNYNVLVLDQALPNNSYISLINTNVWRKENSYNADVSALLFKFANQANSYGISGSGDLSQLFLPGKPDVGYRYYFDVGKIKGNYKWLLSTRTISDRFNPNDLGYLDRNNVTYYLLDEYYNIYKPKGRMVEAYNHVGIDYYRVFNPGVFQQADIFGSHNMTFVNYLTVGFYWSLSPFTNNDYIEPRTFGRFVTVPRNYMAGGFYSSDYRKKFALDLQATNRSYDQQGRDIFSWSVSPRYRFSDKFSMIYSLSGQYNNNDVGYVDNVNGAIYFGYRNVNTVTNALDAAYIFTNTMSLKLDARHYWSQPDYFRYALLGGNGGLTETSYATNHDINFNSFNLYTSFVWQFLPGSEMSVVYQNSIYTSGSQIVSNYLTDIGASLQAPQNNSLSLKVIYYLDYQSMQRLFRKNTTGI